MSEELETRVNNIEVLLVAFFSILSDTLPPDCATAIEQVFIDMFYSNKGCGSKFIEMKRYNGEH